MYLCAWILALNSFQEIFAKRKKNDYQNISGFGHSVCYYVVLNCFQCQISFLPQVGSWQLKYFTVKQLHFDSLS